MDDVRSDLSVLHRIDDLESMPADRFFAFAERLVNYQGTVRATAQREQEEHSQDKPATSKQEDETHKVEFSDVIHNPELLPYFD